MLQAVVLALAVLVVAVIVAVALVVIVATVVLKIVAAKVIALDFVKPILSSYAEEYEYGQQINVSKLGTNDAN